jgi:hypothetical protein
MAARDEEVGTATFVVKVSADRSMVGLFVEGKNEPMSVMPLAGDVTNERVAKVTGAYLELASVCFDALGTSDIRFVQVDGANKIIERDA